MKRPAPASTADDDALVAAARAARRHAHAPYSKFLVGAAVEDERGRIHVGCNVENASYGLTVCAERNAIAAAVVAGGTRLTAVAVVTAADPLATPCGACRQVIAEFALPDTAILLAPPTGKRYQRHTIAALLPESFRFERRR